MVVAMPKLKQPPRLLTVATDVLIDTLVKYCYKCSTEGSLDKLRQHVTFVKENIGLYIPWQLHADFYQKFLERFLDGFGALAEPESHEKAVSQVIMDRKLVGLKCSNLEIKDTEDAHRIQGLQELRLYFRCHNLDSFQLKDLRVLVYYYCCTDSDLQVIGKNCLKLEFLNLPSAEITDDGLFALCLCSKLRDIFLNNCEKLTYEGIRNFLSAHGKIQTFHAHFLRHEADFVGFADMGWSVYPSMKELAIYVDNIGDRDLRCITKKFPNLISLVITGDLDYAADFEHASVTE